MMKKIVCDRKGITMVSLVIVVTVILILTSVLIYNVKDNLKTTNLKEMQSDIKNLRDMISNYYAQYGAIPARIKYTNEEKLSRIRVSGVISEAVDTGEFYIIDLKELENLTLNYGEDYKQITDDMTDEEASQYDDLYIINADSQNIFYVAGINLDNEWFYTDYTSEDVDKVPVDIIEVEKVDIRIPDGFYYVGGTKESGIVISDNQADENKYRNQEVVGTDLQGNQFVWIPVDGILGENGSIENVTGSEKKILLGRYDFDSSGVPTAYAGVFQEQDLEYGNAVAKDIDEFIDSVRINGGYYIARFEASKALNDELESKYNKPVWNEITQPASAKVCYNLYEGVKSDLVNSYAWDTAILFIQKYGQNNYSRQKSLNTSLYNTGMSEDVQLNIYDMASNCYEWTTECLNLDFPCVYRGGVYDYMYDLVSGRYSDSINVSSIRHSFRPILYFEIEKRLPSTPDTKPFLPDGSEVIEDDLDKGVVIKDSNGNEWTWIEVPKSIYTNPEYNEGTVPSDATDYEKIESVMKNYAGYYRESGYEDLWGKGQEYGFNNSEEYDDCKNSMLNSVYENGGFYIGRYETGTEKLRISRDVPLTTPVIQEGVYPYNYVTKKQAQEKSKELATGGRTSSLMFGIQWDLLMTYIEKKNAKTDYDLKIDSSTWGNYANSSFNIIKGKYSKDRGKTFIDVKERYTKPESSILLTTGITKRNAILNIYDLAGNLWEWTLEKTPIQDSPCVIRGGSFSDFYQVTFRSYTTVDESYEGLGFRTALW